MSAEQAPYPVEPPQAPYPDEAPEPTRGLTQQERPRDVSEAQAAVEAQPNSFRRALAAAHPRYLMSMAEGYPPVLKQFIQFCFVLIYPGWLFGLVVGGLLYAAVYAVLWVVFWPVRAWMKKNRPEEYEASQRK